MGWGRDKVFFLTLLPFAAAVVAALAFLAAVFVRESAPILLREGASFITSSLWSPSTSPARAFYGILPAIYGTLVTSAIAVGVAVPASACMAVFVNEVLPRGVREAFSSVVDVMAGMPTVVYGLWALNYLAPALQRFVMGPLHTYLGFIPLFACTPVSGYSLLSAAAILAVMVTPYTFAIVKEAYSSIPMKYREAILSIGAGRFETASVMLGMIRPAVIGAALLGVGRTASETVAVTFVIGNSPSLSPCLFSPGYTVSSLIATQYGESFLYPYMLNALYAAGLILLCIGLGLSGVGTLMMRRWRGLGNA